MPQNAYSFHTQISENALYYFDSYQIDGRVLFIEDLDWTHQMLMPLATLQTQGRLIKTRATKNKDGLLHSTTFEVTAKLCLIACAYSEKNYERLSLPFLLLHLNHSHSQDIAIMNYQKQCKAGLINLTDITTTQRRLQCVIASLENTHIINPFAPFIELPKELPYPRKTLLLLLDFMDIITFFFQHQREKVVNEQTGEFYIKTAPQDIELAFSLLKNSLLRKADELSTNARGFNNWLKKYLQEAQTSQFTALDIRKARSVHPRTLNRYLQELTFFNYLQIVGGNKHRGGFIYKLTELENTQCVQNSIETSLKNTLERVQQTTEIIKNQEQENRTESKIAIIVKPETEFFEKEPIEIPKTEKSELEQIENEPTFFEKNYKRKRINEKEKHTLKLILELETKEPNREYLSSDITALSKRSQCIEARYLKTLWEQGKLTREWRNRQYHYRLYTPNSQTVSQNSLSNS